METITVVKDGDIYVATLSLLTNKVVVTKNGILHKEIPLFDWILSYYKIEDFITHKSTRGFKSKLHFQKREDGANPPLDFD